MSAICYKDQNGNYKKLLDENFVEYGKTTPTSNNTMIWVKTDNPSPPPITGSLQITNNDMMNARFQIVAKNGRQEDPLPSLEYSLGNTNSYQDFIVGETTVSISSGGSLYLRAKNINSFFSCYDLEDINKYLSFYFEYTDDITISGSIQSLLGSSNVSKYCFKGLFENCGCIKDLSNLILPATSLQQGCYKQMFFGCSLLENPPELPATILDDNCYEEMFYNCISLRTAPELPSLYTHPECYKLMFGYCYSLTEAPVLPATILTDSCYYQMFINCTNLSKVEVKFTDWNSSNNSTQLWLQNVSPTGTFVCSHELSEEKGDSYIPNGWVVDWPDYVEPITFEWVYPDPEDPDYTPSVSVKFQVNGYSGEYASEIPKLVYSRNNINYQDFNPNTEVILENPGDKVYVKAKDVNETFSINESNYCSIVCNYDDYEGMAVISGNVKSLTNSDIIKPYHFFKLFDGIGMGSMCGNIKIPFTNLAEDCYNQMFVQAVFVDEMPDISDAKVLADRCFAGMFFMASSLDLSTFIYGPLDLSDFNLPNVRMAEECCYGMFSELIMGLKALPEFPSTNLAPYCYSGMFMTMYGNDKTEIINKLEQRYPKIKISNDEYQLSAYLPAETLQTRCYEEMFYGLSKLEEIEVNFTRWPKEVFDEDIGENVDGIESWLHDVSSTGTFKCPSSLPEPSSGRGGDTIPVNWAITRI